MQDEKPNPERKEDNTNGEWEHFKDFVRAISAVPKEEVDEQIKREREERKREREKRAG